MLAQPPLWFILIAFVCAIGPLVFFHEFGHYIVGRLFGVGAEVFSIGFGREIFGWTDRRGTRWKVALLPLGGYVRFVGDMNPASAPGVTGVDVPPEQRARSFHHKPVWQRFLIVLAGPMANFLLAIAIFAAVFTIYGKPNASNQVGTVQSGSVAEGAGIKAGDTILQIAGRDIDSFEDIRREVMIRAGKSVPIVIDRDGRTISTQATIQTRVIKDEFGREYPTGLLGVSPSGNVVYQRPSFLQSIPLAVSATISTVRMIVDVIGQILLGERSAKELGGPLRIAQVAGDQATLGGFEFVMLLAMISINLGFINLLPVPMLDGGHLLFYGIEAVRRRPVNLQVQDWAFRGGLALILALMVFTTVNDLDSFGLWDRLGRLIG
jgi:regulator of sigma E protease